MGNNKFVFAGKRAEVIPNYSQYNILKLGTSFFSAYMLANIKIELALSKVNDFGGTWVA